jgi:hypothetical protein
MTNWQYRNRLHKLQCNALANVLYHQHQQARWDWWDKYIRIALGISTILGLVFAFPDIFPHWMVWVGLITAAASAAAAIALSIIPIGDISKIHGELFRLWSDLHADTAIAEQKTFDLDPHGDAPQDACERLLEMIGKAERLCADEPKMEKALFQHYEREVKVAKGLSSNNLPITPSVSMVAGEAVAVVPNHQ